MGWKWDDDDDDDHMGLDPLDTRLEFECGPWHIWGFFFGGSNDTIENRCMDFFRCGHDGQDTPFSCPFLWNDWLTIPKSLGRFGSQSLQTFFMGI